MDQYLEAEFEVLKQQIVKKVKQSNLQVRSLSRDFCQEDMFVLKISEWQSYLNKNVNNLNELKEKDRDKCLSQLNQLVKKLSEIEEIKIEPCQFFVKIFVI